MTEQWRYGPSYALVARTSFSYDAGNRLTNLQHRDGSGNNLANYTYTYDNASRLTTEVHVVERSPDRSTRRDRRSPRWEGGANANQSDEGVAEIGRSPIGLLGADRDWEPVGTRWRVGDLERVLPNKRKRNDRRNVLAKIDLQIEADIRRPRRQQIEGCFQGHFWT